MTDDSRHMKRALQLAARGRVRTRPNPMVGAVVVRGARVVGEGYHRAVGRPHAEIEALRDAGNRARGATLYVTLEPCCHEGRTGPCTKAVIAAGVARVVIGANDPNPLVDGEGVAELAAAGVDVTVGVLETACRRLNFGHASLVTTGRPFVTLKLAATLDGKIATALGESKWVTGPVARGRVHRMRVEHDGIAVGLGTVLADDPSLTARSASGRRRRVQPVPAIFDAALDTPPDARVFTAGGPGPVLLLAAETASARREQRLAAVGGRVLRVPVVRGEPAEIDLGAALRALAGEGLRSVLVEGGSGVATSLLRDGLVDRLALFLAPKIMGGSGSVPAFGELGVTRMAAVWALDGMRVRRLGADLLVTGVPRRPTVEEPCSPA